MSPTTSSALAVVGYASLDSATSTTHFRGVDATSILRRPLRSDTPAVGGIAHLVRAAAASGDAVIAVSWIGNDYDGERWRGAVRGSGASDGGVVTHGDRSPSATMLEVETGGTICFFDPGSCHPDRLDDTQVAALQGAGTVLLTVAPRPLTLHVLDELSADARLIWAVKHDADAYDGALVRRLLRRANVISFARGERAFLEAPGPLVETVEPGTLLLETLGADGVRWEIAGHERSGSISVDRVTASDTTGAGDTFIGTAAAYLARPAAPSASTDAELNELVTRASRAARDLLIARNSRTEAATHEPAPVDGASQNEGVTHAER